MVFIRPLLHALLGSMKMLLDQLSHQITVLKPFRQIRDGVIISSRQPKLTRSKPIQHLEW